MLKKVALSAGLIAAAGMLAGAGNANASLYPEVISVSNPAGGTYAAGAYQATITFDVSQVGVPGSGNYSLSITLDNTSDMVNPTNLLKGVQFTLSSGTLDTNIANIGLLGSLETLTTTTTGKGNSAKITGDSQYTAPTTDELGKNDTGSWQATPVAGADTYNFVGNKGAYLVISSPGSLSSDPYPDASNGFAQAGGKGLSPFLANKPIFALGISGATGIPTVSLDEVYFGTGTLGDVSVHVNNPPPVPAGGPLPIPATLPLVGGGLLGLAALALRRRRTL